MRLPVEDELALRAVYAEQAHAVDEGDARGWAQTFTQDGSFSSPTYGAPIVGRAALEQMGRDFYEKSGPNQHRHLYENFVFHLQEPDLVEVKAYGVILVIEPDGPPKLARSTRFNDIAVRVDGAWRIRSRQSIPDPFRKT